MSSVSLQRILTSTTAPVFITDEKGQVVGFNSAGEALLKCESASVRGRRCREVFVGRDQFNNCLCLERFAVREMAARNEAVNPFDMRACRLPPATCWMYAYLVVAVRHEGCKRPTILHLFRPLAHAVDERDQSEYGQPITGKPRTTTDRALRLGGNGFGRLTRREQEVLTLLTAGKEFPRHRARSGHRPSHGAQLLGPEKCTI
jgi:hypothetical protein